VVPHLGGDVAEGLGPVLHEARLQEREPEVRPEEGENADGADALEQVFEVGEEAIAPVVRPRRGESREAQPVWIASGKSTIAVVTARLTGLVCSVTAASQARSPLNTARLFHR
jgi:hypothetical protein